MGLHPLRWVGGARGLWSSVCPSLWHGVVSPPPPPTPQPPAPAVGPLGLAFWALRVQGAGGGGGSSAAAKGASGNVTEELFVLTAVALQHRAFVGRVRHSTSASHGA